MFLISMKTTLDRVLPYWTNVIAPTVKSGKRVVIAAHGNSLRALVKYLDNIPDNVIAELNIPTGVPLVYELDADLKPIPHPDAIAPLKVKFHYIHFFRLYAIIHSVIILCIYLIADWT